MIIVSRQSVLFLIAFFVAVQCYSQKQVFQPDHDELPYYFGMTVGYSDLFLNLQKSVPFIQSDSILVAKAMHHGGLNFGLLATLRANQHFEFRINSQLNIGATESIQYQLGNAVQGETGTKVQSLSSTWISVPVQCKFNSDRIGNFRMYLLGGVKYNYDMSANAGSRTAKDMIQLKNHEWGIEAGIGCSFYLPFTVLSPEIKISNGVSDLHVTNPALKYANIIDKITSRMIQFSIHFED